LAGSRRLSRIKRSLHLSLLWERKLIIVSYLLIRIVRISTPKVSASQGRVPIRLILA